MALWAVGVQIPPPTRIYLREREALGIVPTDPVAAVCPFVCLQLAPGRQVCEGDSPQEEGLKRGVHDPFGGL